MQIFLCDYSRITNENGYQVMVNQWLENCHILHFFFSIEYDSRYFGGENIINKSSLISLLKIVHAKIFSFYFLLNKKLTYIRGTILLFKFFLFLQSNDWTNERKKNKLFQNPKNKVKSWHDTIYTYE